MFLEPVSQWKSWCVITTGDGWRLFTGEVVFQWCEQMTDDGNAPGPAQELLSGTATHVGHISVVDREAKDPAG